MKTYLWIALAAALAAGRANAGPCPCCAAEPAPKPAAAGSVYPLLGGFSDESGRPFSPECIGNAPAVIDLFYASCGSACPITVTALLEAQERLPRGARERTRFILVTLDPERDTAAALADYRRQRGFDTRWILLRGDAGAVRVLAAALGVQYRREPTGQWAHSNLVTVLGPSGCVAYQHPGLDRIAADLLVHIPAGPVPATP